MCIKKLHRVNLNFYANFRNWELADWFWLGCWPQQHGQSSVAKHLLIQNNSVVLKPMWFVPGFCYFLMARACAACRKRDCENWLCFIWMSMPSEQRTAKWIYAEHNMFARAIHLHFIAVVLFLFLTYCSPGKSHFDHIT